MTASVTDQVALDRIGQIAINVKDLARAVRFYRDTLGMRFLFEAPNLAFFDCGGVRLMLTRPETAELNHPGSIVYYFVSDIDTVYESLKQKGVEFLDAPHLIAKMPDHDLWLTAFYDSERNMLGLMEERRDNGQA